MARITHREEQALLDAYVKRGGGIVVIHDGMCGNDSLWYASVIGGAKQHGERNSRHEVMKFHIEDPGNPIVKGISDFDFDDEMFFLLRAEGLAPGADGKPQMWTYGLKVSPDIHVLATTPDPQGAIVPQLWTYERRQLRGGVAIISGHLSRWKAIRRPVSTFRNTRRYCYGVLRGQGNIL